MATSTVVISWGRSRARRHGSVGELVVQIKLVSRSEGSGHSWDIAMRYT